MRLANGGHGGEVEGGEGFAMRQSELGHMTGDAPGGTLGEFVVAHRGEETGAAPAFAIGTGAEVLPDPADRRQA